MRVAVRGRKMNRIITWIESLSKSIIRFFYRLFRRELTDQAWAVWWQFIGFAFVGVSNFLVHYAVYAFFITLLHWSAYTANFAAFLVSVLNAYFWNNRFVFKEEQEGERVWWKVLLKTYIMYAFSGLILTEILLYIEVEVLSLPELLGPVINLFITTPVNFLLSKFWAYRGKKDRES